MKIANLSDIPLGKSIILTTEEGRKIALFNIQGKIYALDNSCPHMGGPLGEGEVEDFCVTCPWHDWQFDVRSGACMNMPGMDAISLPLEIKDQEVHLL